MDVIFSLAMVAAGLILIFSLSKENKVFYVAGGYFILLGGWLMADKLLPERELFAGAWGIAFKVITGVILVVLVAVFAGGCALGVAGMLLALPVLMVIRTCVRVFVQREAA